MLETRQLLIFKTIVELGGFTRAARRLNTSQSAISQQIRALEDEIGMALLVRAGRETRPTPAGDLVLECARQVLDKLDTVQRLLAERADGDNGTVRLGAPEPACYHLIPPLMVALKERQPSIDLHVTSGHPATTLERLRAGDIDVALVPLPVRAPRLRVVSVARDELVAAVPVDHPWAIRRRVEATEFATQPLVLYDRSSPITELTLHFLLEHGVFPRIAAEIEHLESVLHLVRIGVGVAVVPAWSFRREIEAKTLAAVSLGRTGLVRSWGLVYADRDVLPTPLRAFNRLCAETLPTLIAGD